MSVAESDPPSPSLPRRGLILGAGAAALAGATMAQRLPAAAKPPGGPSAASESQQASAVTTTLGSAPVDGYVYRHATWSDFSPELSTSQRRWSSGGAYAATTPSNLWASVEIPAGARVRDLEWYVTNTSTPVTGYGRLWLPDSAQLVNTVLDTTIPSSASMTATRGVVPDDSSGPYPLGAKIYLGIYTTTDGKVAVNGVRVGFAQGAGATGLLPAPIRAYDSRNTGGKLAAGSTRTITLPSSIVSPGTSGVLVNVTAVNGEAGGYLKVYPANAPEPAASAMNFAGSGAAIANAITVGVSSSRQIKVKTSAKVHVIIDVTGTVA